MSDEGIKVGLLLRGGTFNIWIYFHFPPNTNVMNMMSCFNAQAHKDKKPANGKNKSKNSKNKGK